jgi:hypothetical protein
MSDEIEQKAKLADFLPKEDDAADEAELIAKLIGPDSKLIVDTSLPKDFEIEIMAQLLVDHLVSFKQTKAAWRAARNGADHQRATQLWQQLQYNQLTAALIQAEYPEAKAIAQQLAKGRAKVMQAQRDVKTEAE